MWNYKLLLFISSWRVLYYLHFYFISYSYSQQQQQLKQQLKENKKIYIIE